MIFTPFPRPAGPISSPPPFAEANVASMKHSDSSILPLAQRIRKIRGYFAQNFLTAPLLEAPMNRLVVRVALRKHVPLRTGVQNPQNGFQNSACWDRFAVRTTVRNIFLWKVVPNPLPLVITQFQHVHEFTALH